MSETTIANGKEIKKEAVESSESVSSSTTFVKETTKSGTKHREEIRTSGDEERNRFIKTIRGADIERKLVDRRVCLQLMLLLWQLAKTSRLRLL